MVRHRRNLDRVSDHWARDAAAKSDPEEFIAVLRADAASRFAPPGFGPEALAAILTFLSTARARTFGVPRNAFDIDWSHGDGPTIQAPAIEFIGHLCRGQALAPG